MSKLEKIIVGSIITFAPAGETIDLVEVSEAAFPDDDPAENWLSLGEVSESSHETEKESDFDWVYKNGHWRKIPDERVVSDIQKFKSRDASEIFWRMALGLKDEIVDATAQTPNEQTRRWIEGWLKTELQMEGQQRVVQTVYGRLMIDEDPKWSKDPTKPGYSFVDLYSAIATVTPDNIVA
ncbi:hypothetical protein [Rubritalea sp.]|uniref:hypothetical protein n=1 Tax=Rubritalea sp. TaxID=2109375 RepID=UPI003EF74789